MELALSFYGDWWDYLSSFSKFKRNDLCIKYDVST